MSINQPTERLLYPMKEAAGKLGIGITKTYELVKAGHLRRVKIGGRAVVHHVELERLATEIAAGKINLATSKAT